MELRRVRDVFGAVSEELLRRSRREAEAGARIVLWGEDDAPVLVEDEFDLIASASRVARETGVYIGVSAKVWRRGTPRPWEKKLVLLRPDGAVGWSYSKSLLLPGNETPGVEPGDGRLRFASTPYGTVSAAICFEADSPRFLRQAGQGRADVVLIPGDDSRELDPWHAQMAVFRAVEQGFNMVRHANQGLSIATDYQGRVRATMDHFETASDRVMVAQLPTKGVRTLYSRVGDLFAYLAVAGLTLLALVAARRASSVIRD
jgi:apolipoprotein N-acyltransferase